MACVIQEDAEGYNITPYSDWPMYNINPAVFLKSAEPDTIRMLPFTPAHGEGVWDQLVRAG